MSLGVLRDHRLARRQSPLPAATRCHADWHAAAQRNPFNGSTNWRPFPFVAAGSLPDWDADEEAIDRRVKQLEAISAPVTPDVPLPPVGWARTLLAVEIVFVSDLAGSGVEWPTTTGISDESTIRALRSIQRKPRIGPAQLRRHRSRPTEPG